MSILLRGMEMPENCSCCGMETGAGFCSAMPDNFCGYTDDRKRPVWCPLAEIKTPHGGLIDKDVLIDIFADRLAKVSVRYGIDSEVAGAVAGAMKLLDLQPTVVEAEGEE